MAKVHDIVPCRWFENQAEEAAHYYTGIFKTGRVTKVTRYSEVGQETHHRPPGSVLTVEFELNGKTFTALSAMAAMMRMKNLDLAAVKAAYNGKVPSGVGA